MNNLEIELKSVINKLVADDVLHAKWLNSLSLMENTGARKISRYEDPIQTNITILKHAAEEARHAYYLKKQIEKLVAGGYPDYSFDYLMSPMKSYRYLHQLDVSTCRYAKDKLNLEGRAMYHAAYLLVTYAIEVRADMLYAIYQDALTAQSSKVNVKSIILEEEGHLEEMTKMLKDFAPHWEAIAKDICEIEDILFTDWIKAVKEEIAPVAA